MAELSHPPILDYAPPARTGRAVRVCVFVLLNVPFIILAARLFREEADDVVAASLTTLLFGVPLMFLTLVFPVAIGHWIIEPCWPSCSRMTRIFLISLPLLCLLIQIVGAVLSIVLPGNRGSLI